MRELPARARDGATSTRRRLTARSGSTARHWLRFNVVGAMGITIQLVTLALLVRARAHYLVATAIAVEASVLHNFVWHRRWTWSDRLAAAPRRSSRALLVRFNLTAGLLSLGGNLALMHVFVEAARLPPIAANLATIAICGLVNFVVADRWVFGKKERRAAATNEN